MDTCLWVVGCKKPNPRMNSCMESRVWNPPLMSFFFFWGGGGGGRVEVGFYSHTKHHDNLMSFSFSSFMMKI